MQARTVLLGGFSKDYAMTGWRIGYMASSADLLSAARKVHQYTIMSARRWRRQPRCMQSSMVKRTYAAWLRSMTDGAS